MSFEWQTDETAVWEDPIEQPPTPKPPRRRWPWAMLGILLLVGIVGFFAYRELVRRVDVGTENVEADVLASYDVVQAAILEQDNDLLATFMSGADFEWVTVLDDMVTNGRFYQRAPLNLTHIQSNLVPTPTITLSDNLQEAALTTTRHYEVAIGNGLTETVTLMETAVYRQGPNRWLLSPPKPEFWGTPQTTSGEIFTLSYPNRDADIAERLVYDIDAKLLELCANVTALRCPDDLRVRMTLGTNPERLQLPAAAQGSWLPLEGLRLTSLPTPTLVGLPVDEAGYQALYRGYAAQVVTAVMTGLLNAECCSNRVVYQAAVADQLARLSLQPWPLSSQEYQQFFLNPVGWSDLRLAWQTERPLPTPAEDWAVYALVDYVVNELQVMNSIEVMQSVVLYAERPYIDWIQTVLAPLQSTNLILDKAWVHFISEHVGDAAPPVPLPNQALYLACADSQSAWSLVRYDVAADQFRYLDRSVTGWAILHGLAGDNGVIVGEEILSQSSSQIFLWLQGQKTEISWPRTENTPGGMPLGFDPTQQYMLLSGYPGMVAPFGLFPAASCLQGESCNIEVADGYPIWSPDGETAVIAANADVLDDVQVEGMLFLGNGLGEIPELSATTPQLGRLLGTGSSPFWLDDDRYGFVRFDVQAGSSALFVGTVDGSQLTQLLTAADLAKLLPEESQQQQMRIHRAWVHPQDARKLLVATADSLLGEGTAHLFVYDLAEQTADVLFPFLPEPTAVRRGYEVSENGRFLAITSQLRASQQWMLYMHDLQTGQTRQIELGSNHDLPPHLLIDWSQDGRWLTIVQDGYVRLLNTTSSYERLVVSPVLSCSSAAWVSD